MIEVSWRRCEYSHAHRCYTWNKGSGSQVLICSFRVKEVIVSLVANTIESCNAFTSSQRWDKIRRNQKNSDIMIRAQEQNRLLVSEDWAHVNNSWHLPSKHHLKVDLSHLASTNGSISPSSMQWEKTVSYLCICQRSNFWLGRGSKMNDAWSLVRRRLIALVHFVMLWSLKHNG